MHTETATYVKNHLGEVMDRALQEPVVIQRSGRNTIVLLSYAAYTDLLERAASHPTASDPSSGKGLLNRIFKG